MRTTDPRFIGNVNMLMTKFSFSKKCPPVNQKILLIKGFIVAWTTENKKEPIWVCWPRIKNLNERKILKKWINSLS